MVDTPSRKLAVIMHADVVGSTSLGHQNETLAHLRINDAFTRFSKTIKCYGGNTHEIRGDALVAEFARASDAVCAAIAFQDENMSFNASLEDDLKPRLRVGIAMGEVVIGNNTITGDGVVLAQRLEQKAAPGGICIQGAVYETLPRRLPFGYDFLGECELKGFEEPVRAYTVSIIDGESIPSPEVITSSKPVFALPDKPSIAVLPFTNMSDDPEQEYFADGVAEDVITELSREPDLFVIARNSSFSYKDQSVDIREIASELGVRYVLEGSLRKAGNRIRLNAQLIDAPTNSHVWAERYDRALVDIFEVQDELTNTIHNTLLRKISDISIERALRRAPQDLDAYDHQLRAFGLVFRFDPTDNAEAIREAESALALDPDFARAHMTLAWAHLFAVMSGLSEDPGNALKLGHEAARNAIAADREDFWGYAVLGAAELLMQRHDSALSSVDHALELNPNNADARAVRASVLNFLSRPEEGLSEIKLAIRHNPHYPNWYLPAIGRSYYLLERYHDAIPYLERAVNLSPEFTSGRTQLAANYVAVGRLDEARTQVAALLKVIPDLTLTQVGKMAPFSKEEELNRFLSLLGKAGLPK